jgi:hypothetical protein
MTIDVAGSSLLGLVSTNTGIADIEVNDQIGLSDSVNWLYTDFGTPGAVGATGPIVTELDSFSTFSLSFQGPSGVFPSAQIPSVFPGMTEWTNLSFFSFATSIALLGGSDKAIQGTISNLSSSPVVPEPSTFVLTLLGGVTMLWSLRSRRSKFRRESRSSGNIAGKPEDKRWVSNR